VTSERRGIAARLGIVALNIPLSGLGLLRIGHGRAGALFIAAPLAAYLAIVLYYALGPVLTFRVWIVLVGSAVAIWLLAILLSGWMSWGRSAERHSPDHWWSRWYGLLGIWAVSLALPLSVDAQRYYRGFYVPSEAMTPTLARDDRFVARMDGSGELRRGDIVLVRSPHGAIYVSRIAALAGDRIAMTEGTVILNGRPVVQRSVGPGEGGARRLAEQFPGEAQPHEIQDSGMTMGDEFAEVTVRPGHIFLLGDNRDHAADSRFSADQYGLGQRALEDVLGRPLFFYSWTGGGKAGRPVR
jgi:signal peptidase I